MLKLTTLSILLVASSMAFAQTLTPVKLPVVLPLSSSLSGVALEIKNSATLAVNRYAPRFAEKGFKLELAVYDDKGSPDLAKGIAETLKADPSVLALVGGVTSGVALNLAAGLRESRIAVVSSSAVSNELTDTANPNFNRLIARNAALTEGTAAFMKDSLGAKTLFLVDDASVFGLDSSQSMAAAAQRQGIGVLEKVSTQERADFSAVLGRIKTAKPDVVQLYFTSSLAAAALVKQLKAASIAVELFGTATFLSPQFFEAAGKDAQGAYFNSSVAPASAYNGAKVFLSEYKAAYGDTEPGGGAVMGYDAATVVLEAMLGSVRVSGKLPSRSTVERAVRRTRLKNLLSGNVAFNSSGDRRDSVVYILQIGSDSRPRVSNSRVINR